MSEAAREYRRILAASDDVETAQRLVEDLEAERGYSVKALSDLADNAWTVLVRAIDNERHMGLPDDHVPERLDLFVTVRRQGAAAVEVAEASGSDTAAWGQAISGYPALKANVGLFFYVMPSSRLIVCGLGPIRSSGGITDRWPELSGVKRASRVERLVPEFMARARTWAFKDVPDRVILPLLDAKAAFTFSDRGATSEFRERTIVLGGKADLRGRRRSRR